MRGLREKLQIEPPENLLGSSMAAWYGPGTVATDGASELHLVVACADRKRASAGSPARLGTVAAASSAERCAAWWRLLNSVPARTPARDLYVGDHWSIAKDLPNCARRAGYEPHLWVASAGYGLVTEDAVLASYSATFSVDSPDSVVSAHPDAREASQQWWSHLAQRRLRGEDQPRFLTELAERATPGAVLMLVASPAYVVAMERDLERIATRGARVRLMLVTSNPGPEAVGLRESWIPTTATLRMSLGGALTSLHTRVARWLLEKISPAEMNAETARRHIERLASCAPELPTIQRTQADDDQIRKFIRQSIRRDAGTSYTRLLREYRTSGHACEQSRFRALFVAEREGR